MLPVRGKLERKRLLSAPLFYLRPLSSSFPFVWPFGLHGPFTVRVSVSQSAESSGSVHALSKTLSIADIKRHVFYLGPFLFSPIRQKWNLLFSVLTRFILVEDRAEVYAIVPQSFLLCYKSASHTRSESLTRIYLFFFYENSAIEKETVDKLSLEQ